MGFWAGIEPCVYIVIRQWPSTGKAGTDVPLLTIVKVNVQSKVQWALFS